MQFTYGALIPLPIDEAFEFVSTPANWPTFVDSLERAEAREGWGSPGGKARMATTMLGRTVITDLELIGWDPPHEFRYIGHNEGRPDMDNRRVFEVVPEGTRLTGTTTAPGRGGRAALGDLVSYLALRRMMRRAMAELPAQALKWDRARHERP
jgi:hypothetical protein